MATLASLFLYSTLSINSAASTEDSIESKLMMSSIEKESDFKCASTIQDVIPLLGRGDHFPQFLIEDIHRELNRQIRNTVISSIECYDAPTLRITQGKSDESTDAQFIKDLVVEFPLWVNMDNETDGGTKKMKMIWSYEVKKLNEPKETELFQHFELLERVTEDKKYEKPIRITINENIK